MIFSVPLGEPVYPRSRSIKRAIGLTLVFSSRVFSTSQLHLIACESSLQRSNWLTFFIEFPSMMVMPFLIFFWRGFPSMDGFFLPLSPPFSSTKFLLFCLLLLFCRIATAQNFSLFPGRLLDFVNKREILIVLSIGVEYQNEEGKYPHTTQRRGLSLLFSSLLFSSLLFSSLLSSLETQRRRRKRCITDTHTNTPRAPC